MAFSELDTISEKLLDILKKHGTLTLSELSVLMKLSNLKFCRSSSCRLSSAFSFSSSS